MKRTAEKSGLRFLFGGPTKKEGEITLNKVNIAEKNFKKKTVLTHSDKYIKSTKRNEQIIKRKEKTSRRRISFPNQI